MSLDLEPIIAREKAARHMTTSYGYGTSDFLAHARADIVAMIKEIEELRAELDDKDLQIADLKAMMPASVEETK